MSNRHYRDLMRKYDDNAGMDPQQEVSEQYRGERGAAFMIALSRLRAIWRQKYDAGETTLSFHEWTQDPEERERNRKSREAVDREVAKLREKQRQQADAAKSIKPLFDTINEVGK